ncbi:3-keto-disaccharide hydrolase [Synoicihabitans lomoniglobus]|uniref:DUF1080 domain-containing protein n=1 Tax=Synoicihabitans lomoniglobus TaxID=2909285 RepID=A0AAF0CMK3_9BACT|nr:DUF1080 domain-containing protein [Opitutaceae bacterium LMO-M01]WED63396.1 DUF1080 domain-containing protein [Opitutaceae bacterium LMO-M01]
MKKQLSLLVILTAVASFAVAADDGFVSIFNGRDLTGWKPTEEKPGSFSVENGTLKVSDGRAHLFYVGETGAPDIRNFELKAKVKTLPQANGGVYFHTQYQATGWPTVGFECQVNSTHRDPKKTGSLYGVVNVLALADGEEIPPGSLANTVRDRAPSTDGEWFDYFIKVDGNRVILKVNGETTVDWTQPRDFDPATALKNMPGRKLGSGTFALQGHDPGSVMFYKDIQLKITD